MAGFSGSVTSCIYDTTRKIGNPHYWKDTDGRGNVLWKSLEYLIHSSSSVFSKVKPECFFRNQDIFFYRMNIVNYEKLRIIPRNEVEHA